MACFVALRYVVLVVYSCGLLMSGFFSSLNNWNVSLFELLRANPDSPAFVIHLAKWLAELPLFFAMGLSAWYLLKNRDFLTALQLGLACGLGMAAEFLIKVFAFHARPFAAGFGPALVTHAATNSMPSTHATLIWTTAMVFLLLRQKRLGLILFALGCMIAWARVYVGIHWPADMVGALIVAFLSALGSSYLIRYAQSCWMNRRRVE